MASPADDARVNPDSDDRHTERLTLLGGAIELSATMEGRLRQAFCALVGSKYAAVVAGGQTADWLIEQSKALADAHHEMSDVDREAIKTVLNRCKAVNEQRNHLAHSVAIGLRFNPAFQMVRSRRHKYSSDVRPFTLTDIRAVASELLSAGIALTDVMTEAVGRDLMEISEALFWEDSFGDDEDS